AEQGAWNCTRAGRPLPCKAVYSCLFPMQSSGDPVSPSRLVTCVTDNRRLLSESGRGVYCHFPARSWDHFVPGGFANASAFSVVFVSGCPGCVCPNSASLLARAAVFGLLQ